MAFGNRRHSARRERSRWLRAIAGTILVASVTMASSAEPPEAPAQPPGRKAAAKPATPVQPVAAPPGAEGGTRPQSAKRLVRLFNFEEPENPYPVPDHWFHAQDEPGGLRRPGFPQYNQAAFDFTMAASGAASVRLPTQGGSTALRLKPGEIPIFPDADYTVSAKVRTVDLEHARAFLTARLLDQRLNPIPGTEVRSAPVLSPATWETVHIVVPGKSADAAWLQIDLELLQPAQFEPPPGPGLAGLTVNHEDISGAALFDDVAVALVPRERFWTEQPTGVFIAPEKPTLGMLARDQGGEELVARVRVMDADSRMVAEESFHLDPSARPTLWTPPLPGFGWYRAVMEIDAADVNVTRSELWFCWMPRALNLTESPRRAADYARFGIIADTIPEPLLAQLPPFVERARTRFIVLPAFDAGTPATQARAALSGRSPVIEKLLTQGQQITLALSEVPPTLAASQVLDPTDALGLCEHDPNAWWSFIEPTLDVYGQRILRYQIGRASDTHALRRDPSQGTTAFESALARLVPGPKISLPWRSDHPIPRVARATLPGAASQGFSASTPEGPLVDGLEMVFPLGFAPGAMKDLGMAWRDAVAGGNTIELTVSPELPDVQRFGARARAVEMARRTAEFWGAMGTGISSGTGARAKQPAASSLPPAPSAIARLAVNSPWRIADGPEGSTLLPGPEYPVLALMAERLAGRRVVGVIPAGAGVRAMLLAEPTGAGTAAADDGAGRGEALIRACVVAWNEAADPDRSWIDVYPAGDHVEVVDMFGNSTSVNLGSAGARSAESAGIQVRVPLTDAPVFIEGVDPYLAQFTSSFRLTPSFLPSVVSEHDLHVELTNPWPVRITGQIQLKEPETPAATNAARGAAWAISPNILDFAIAPGQSASLPLTITFGPGQLAGMKDLILVARVLADRQYPPIHTGATIEVGLPDLELVPEVQLGPTPTGPDVIVTAAVTNKDIRPRTLRVELTAKDTPSQQLQISDLPPSQTVTKWFVIHDGAKSLAGLHLRVTLGDDESAARLSKAVMVPDTR